MKKLLTTYWPGIFITLIAIAIGIDVYQDYGLSWDEESQRTIGIIFDEYIHGKFLNFDSFDLKDHGPGFEWVYLFIEKSFNITDFRDIFLMRHLVTYLVFVLCMFSGYVLVYALFKNKWLASFALIALIFHPRIFAHSFFNPKDVPAMSMFILSMAIARWAFAKGKLIPFLLLGILCGYGTAIRLTNIVIMIPFALFLLIDLTKAIKQRQKPWKVVINGSVLVTGFMIMLIACWPALWDNPIKGFIDVFESNAQYGWAGDVLFSGTPIKATKLPWNYIPTWMFLTTPEFWLLLAIIGIILLIAHIIEQPEKFIVNGASRNFLLALSCFFLPLFMVIILNSVLYDGWRHMYFIYPPLIVIATYGLNEILKKRPKWMLYSLCALQVILVGVFMVKNHPHQQVYFNSFLSHEKDNLMKRYELDYWGASAKSALEWVLDHEQEAKVYVDDDFHLFPVKNNYNILTKDQRARLTLTDDLDKADYYIEVFRTWEYRYHPEIHNVYDERILGSPIFRIVKMR